MQYLALVGVLLVLLGFYLAKQRHRFTNPLYATPVLPILCFLVGAVAFAIGVVWIFPM